MSSSISDYLNQIGKIPLLTAAEEIELGNAIQQMMPLVGKADLDKEEKRIIRVGERAKRRMIQGNLRLVIRVAGKYSKMTNRITMQDLIQEGNIGLIRAAEMFDPSRGYKFSTYAYWWIKQGIMRASQMQDRMIKLPSGAPDALRKIKFFSLDYQKEHGRVPTLQECAEVVGLQPETVRAYLASAIDAGSLDAKAKHKEDDASSIIDLIASDDERPEDELLLDTQIEAVRQALPRISAKAQKLLTLRYGLNGQEPLSNPAIAKEYGMYRESMRRQILNAEQELKAALQGEPPGKLPLQKISSSLNWGWS
jgi:RNA polymerase primary sigma factor